MADNIGGAVDVTDPRDLADLGDDVETPPTPPKDDKDRGELPPDDEKEDLPEEDEEKEEKEDEEIPEENEDGEKPPKEDEEIEEEVEEVDSEAAPNQRPSFKEITKKYPKFFKEFPAVREALGRELAYTQEFPTVEEAKDAKEVISNFTKLEQSIMSGDPALLLGSLHSKDEKALAKFAKNFLPTVQRGNPKLFSALVTPYIKRVFANALDNAESAGNENLKKSVQWMSKFVFGTQDGSIPPDEKEEEDGKPSSRESELEEENKRLAFSTLQRFSGDVKDYTEKVMKREILKNVDPENAMPEFMQDALIGKIVTEIQKSLNSDVSHTQFMTKLWQKAQKNGYTQEDRSQLINAFLARARKILPSIRDKHKKEVMKKLSSNNREERIPNNNRRRIPESGVPSSRNSSVKARDVNWKKTSDEDILDDKYVPNRR